MHFHASVHSAFHAGLVLQIHISIDRDRATRLDILPTADFEVLIAGDFLFLIATDFQRGGAINLGLLVAVDG